MILANQDCKSLPYPLIIIINGFYFLRDTEMNRNYFMSTKKTFKIALFIFELSDCTTHYLMFIFLEHVRRHEKTTNLDQGLEPGLKKFRLLKYIEYNGVQRKKEGKRIEGIAMATFFAGTTGIKTFTLHCIIQHVVFLC